MRRRSGHIALDDGLGEAFYNRGLSDAGLADEDGVVLRAPTQDLNDALNLIFPADYGVELLLLGENRQIAAEGVEGGGLGLLSRGRLGAGTPLIAKEADDFGLNAAEVDFHVLEHFGGDAFTLLDQAEEDVFRTDVTMVEAAGLLDGQLKDLLGTGRERYLARRRGSGAPLDLLFDLEGEGVDVNPQVLEGARGDTLGLAAEAQKDVLRPNVLASKPGRLFTRGADYMFGAFCKPVPHGVFALPVN